MGGVWLNERLDNLREDVEVLSSVRCSEERVEPAGGLIYIDVEKYLGDRDNLIVDSLFHFSQWRDLS